MKKIHIFTKDILFFFYMLLFLIGVLTGNNALFIYSFTAEIITILGFYSVFLTRYRKRKFFIAYDKTMIILFIMQILYIWIGYFTYSYYPNVTIVFALRHLLLLPYFFVSISDECIIRIITISKYYIIFADIIYLIMYPALGVNGSIFGTYQYVATYTCLLIIGILAKIFTYNKIYRWDYITLLFGLLVLFSTGKRSFILVIILITLVGILFIKNKKKHNRLITLFILCGFFGGIVLLLFPDMLKSISRFQAIGETDLTLSGRTKYWALGIYLLKNNLLHGIGYGNFGTFIENNFDFAHETFNILNVYAAHNIYVQLLAETGIIGLIIFLAFFITALVKTVKVINSVPRESYIEKRNLTLSLFLQLWFLFYGFSGNDLYMPAQLGLYIISLTPIWSGKRKNRDLQIQESKIMEQES